MDAAVSGKFSYGGEEEKEEKSRPLRHHRQTLEGRPCQGGDIAVKVPTYLQTYIYISIHVRSDEMNFVLFDIYIRIQCWVDLDS